jgi:hypothetical protein
MKTIVVTLAVALGIGLGFVLPAGASSPTLPVWTTRPCKTEDSVNCFWDARTQGNGRGHSFIVRQVPGRAHMVCVFYVDRRYAKKHDYCS